jgi:diguanylate cyclase (GGDEF)-like protein
LHVAKPTDSQNLRQSLLRVLRNTGVAERRALARVEATAKPGQPVFSTLLSLLTHLDFPEAAARRHWQKVRAHQASLRRSLKRDPGLRVALLDYFVNQTRVLRNPKVIEMALYQRTEQTALGDPLTGLFNRAYLMQVLRREISRARRHGRPLAVALFDVDDFKRINDTHGHLEGDRVLMKAAGVIGECLRDIDVAARYGGEEFAVVLPDTGRAGAFVVAQRVRVGFETTVRSGREPVTVSGGVAAYPIDGLTPQQLLHCADQGLYRAKAAGKNRIEPESDERRQHGRVRWQRTIGIERLGGRLIEARGQNLSEGGMLVSMTEPVPVGAKITVVVRVNDDGPLALRGHVVRLAPRGGEGYEAGLRLATDPTGGNALVLRRLMPPAATA